MVLAELGADVIKVEQPHTGDDSRRLAPKVNGESYPFAMPNRSKRSVSLDLKDERGRDLFLKLAADADLVIENFRPGVANRLGIGYDDVRRVRDDILYCSISGFGQTGPYRDRPGFDIMAQGTVGFLRMTGQPEGRPGEDRHRDQRHRRRRHRHLLDHGRADDPPADRQGPVHGHLAGRRRPGLDGLGVRRLLRGRRGAAADGYPPPPLDAVPGLPHRGRLRDHRRRQRPAVGAPGHHRRSSVRSGSRTTAFEPCPTGWTTSTSSSARSRRSR